MFYIETLLYKLNRSHYLEWKTHYDSVQYVFNVNVREYIQNIEFYIMLPFHIHWHKIIHLKTLYIMDNIVVKSQYYIRNDIACLQRNTNNISMVYESILCTFLLQYRHKYIYTISIYNSDSLLHNTHNFLSIKIRKHMKTLTKCIRCSMY